MTDKPTENKTQHLHILMAPSEVTAIDDWGYANRIRTRGEAIRRLCQIGLAVSQEVDALERTAVAFSAKLSGARDELLPLYRNNETDPTLIADAVDGFFPGLMEDGRRLPFQALKVVLAVRPFLLSGSVEDAEELRRQIAALLKLEPLEEDDEQISGAEILPMKNILDATDKS